jgi:hypothetical protein
MNKKLIKVFALSSLFIFNACKKDEQKTLAPISTVSSAEEGTISPSNSKPIMDSIAEKYGLTEVEFDKREFDFGTINQGDKVETTFTIKNTGKKELVITDAFGSCGCTVPEVSKEPIAPGKSTTIKVKFDSANKQGLTQKTVTVRCNTKTIVENLTIKANILTK